MATLTKQQRANLESERAALQRELASWNNSMKSSTNNPIDAIFTSKNTLNTISDNVNRVTNRIYEINQLLNEPTPKPTPRRTTNTNLTKPVVDADWYTSATERNMRTRWAEFWWVQNTVSTFSPQEVQNMLDSWMSVEQIQMYDDDNKWWYENQRNQTVWNNWTTRWQIFDQAVEKFLANPDSFNDAQKQALVKVWQQLWYFRDWTTTAANNTQNITSTAAAVQPTVQPTVTHTPTQRQVNNAHDAYYAPQNARRWITL